jgi:hypothetical protein
MSVLSFLKELLFGIFWTSGNLIQVIPTYLGIAYVILFFISSRWKGKMKRWAVGHKKYMPYVLIGLLVVSLVFTSYSLYENKEPNFATPDALLSPNLNGMRFRITDLARETAIIRNRVFTDCDIYGPAIVMFQDSNVADIYLPNESVSSCLIESNTPTITGAIGFYNCVITNCRFWHIGILGNTKQIEVLKSNVHYDYP